VALEHFKTQVLLLHSQQSTLDALSAGFGDRYAVHLATTGTEALNTLGATPIHVIVSAQDLPGMSGLEALREAKKRSPDTIGILLAGNDPGDGLEALVGDKEVFQIVRGSVTPDALQDLIDTATKRVRMLTISESANDQAANVDEPVEEPAGEHIVMETSENGTTIISDGTGRMPALRSHHVHIAPHAGGRDVDVLVLTKDEDFLETIRDSSHESHTVHHANTPAQAEAIVRDHKVGVLVTDAAMVGSNIELVTERLRKDRPRLVAVVAGRRDDGELLMDLINRGQVYRFLLKPVSPGRARLAIEASVKHHLEAGDAAFKPKPAADTPAPKDTGKAAKTGKVARIMPKMPAPRHESPATAPDRKAPALDNGASNAAAAPHEVGTREADSHKGTERLDSAFGDSGRFTRTMTGLAATVGKTFGGAEEGGNAGDAASDSAPSGLRPKMLIGGAAAAAVLAALVFWTAFSGAPEPDAPLPIEADIPSTVSSPSVVETDIPVSASPAPEPEPAYKQFLDEARIARENGEIVVPPGSNAIELYIAAREIAPELTVIDAELAQVITTAIGLAESALLDQRTNDAAQTLRLVRLGDPNNPRLPFLEAQLTQLQLRASLDQARLSIRDGRFEDAAIALANAERAAGARTPEIVLLIEELATARSQQQIDEVLALANERVAQGALTSPANDNARYYYELALSNAPDNAVAQQGLAIVASKLVLNAREAIDAGQFDSAQRFLDDAAALDPQSADLDASIQALNTAREEQAAAAREEAERQAALEREAALAEAGDTAGSAGETSLVGGSALNSRDRSAGADLATTPDGAAPTAMQRTAGQQSAGAPASVGDQAADEQSGSNTQSASGSVGYVPISSLKRTNYVAPRYPRSAQRRNITGWVDVSFTVDRSGNVINVGILDSKPGDVFNEAATEAVSQWRFEPFLENGAAVEKMVAVRLMFSLE
jgi:TonB family protein